MQLSWLLINEFCLTMQTPTDKFQDRVIRFAWIYVGNQKYRNVHTASVVSIFVYTHPQVTNR